MPVVADRSGIVHVIAYCDACMWDDAWGDGNRTQGAIRASARRHVESTGHNVTVETGSSTTYRKTKE